MYQLDHPHIIKLFHHIEDEQNLYLFLEYASGGTLLDKMR